MGISGSVQKKNDPLEKHWYIAYVQSCKEKKAAESLARNGYEYYLPIQKEMHRWSDRNKIVDRLVLPRLIFIHCMEHERIPIRQNVHYIAGFMSIRGPYTPAIVRDDELEVFRRMVEGGRRVDIQPQRPVPGDRVKVVDGPLQGLVCELLEVNGQRCLGVSIGGIGTATMDLDIDSVEKIQQ